jgi:hypothetical protein
VTPSALLDPRFRDRGSVQIRNIQAVLCALVGATHRSGAYPYAPAAGRFIPTTAPGRQRFSLVTWRRLPIASVRHGREADATRPTERSYGSSR